ncbi:hypothetical protein, partial [Escherichia coli]|uniref:hypothetical protein n=1 Tax=Escherichia coli TaxID=562 RepID=UPI0013D26F26
IMALYGHYEPSRAKMYRSLADDLVKEADALLEKGQFTKAHQMADRIREFREAAALLASTDRGAGI